jgi:cyanobactin maturation PatA/PatG family protease
MSNSIIANDQPGPEGEAAELRLSTEPTAMAGGETRNAGFNGVQAAGLTPSDCGCGNSCGGQLAYVIGRLGYDFGSRARQESFNADIIAAGGTTGANDPNAMIGYLSDNPYAAADLIWTLSVDSVPMYAVAPSGAFGARGYERLLELLRGQQPDAQGQAAIQRVSVPGTIVGRARLLNSQEVPVIRPALRGIYAWNMAALSEQANKNVPAKSRGARVAQFQSFFDRLFYELRNAGLAPSERAINFAGTTLFQLTDVFRAKIEEDLALHRIEVSKSLVCPQGGDCWDVSMILFDPKHTLDRAREMFRFTVDVSNEIPVRVGQVNSWATYATLL